MKINYRTVLQPVTMLVIILLTSCFQTLSAQNIPLNKYKLPVVNTRSLYKQLVAKDSNQTLVDLTTYIPNIKKDIRYATTNNFTHQILYPSAGAYLLLPAAKALKAVQQELNKKGLGLKIFDGYRPYRATEKMWEVVPDDRYAASPRKGSGHNRGMAVDLTIVNLSTGKALEMPTDFDIFNEKAHPSYVLKDPVVAANRRLLISTMGKYGFTPSTTEWWHYFMRNYKKYPLMDIPFNEL